MTRLQIRASSLIFCSWLLLAYPLAADAVGEGGKPTEQSNTDIRAYGAKCDGTTDDTEAIQAAIGRGNKHLVIPPGVCILSPKTSTEILDLPSGTSIWIQGEGIGVSVLRIKPHAGDYSVIFGPKWGTWPSFAITDLTVDQNSTNNPVSSTIQEHGRILVASGGGNSLLVDHLEVTNINSRQVVMSTTLNTTISNSRFLEVGGGSTYHDSSTVYLAADNSTVTGNIFRSSGINSAGAATAIETHGGNQIISGNVIDNYETGMNITGIELTETQGVTVSGNVIHGAFYGIDLWSGSYGDHRSGYGLGGVVIANNNIYLTRSAWRINAVTGGAMPGNTAGIFVNASSNLPLHDILIIGNLVEWDRPPLEIPADATSMGIGYWDATNSNSVDGLMIKDNVIANAPMTGIYLGVGGLDFEVSSNTILNPASSSTATVYHGFKSGIFIGNVKPIVGTLRLSQNQISASVTSSHMAHGICIASKASATVVATGDVISVAESAGKDFIGPVDLASPGATPYLQLVQVGVSLTPNMLPVGTVTANSTVIDLKGTAIWVASSEGHGWKKAVCAGGCISGGIN